MVKRPRALAAMLLICFLAFWVAMLWFRPGGTDMNKVCKAQCHPKFSRVIPDPAYFSPTTGKPKPLKCACY